LAHQHHLFDPQPREDAAPAPAQRAPKPSPVPAAATPAQRYAATRALSEALAAPLSDADATIQSMPDASPTKWHLAHTTWFFETFLLRDHVPGYRLYREDWPFLFNSYYEAEGARLARASRGLLSRPALAEIREWRAHVDEAMASLLARAGEDAAIASLVALGIAHEQQHQELLLTDIKHALAQNPLGPAMWPAAPANAASPGSSEKNGPASARRASKARSSATGAAPASRASAASSTANAPPAPSANAAARPATSPSGWIEHVGGIAQIGHGGSSADSFAFDNEGPAHRVLLEPFAFRSRLVTNGEWAEFIADGGYRTASLWLSDGWDWVQRKHIAAPLYWREDEHFTHAGWQKRDPDAPVAHISYFEADAFAAWAGCRLPTEFEWEEAARGSDPAAGNQLDGPHSWAGEGAAPPLPRGTSELFGDCWQFTRSAYLPYPRFRPARGAVGEYNGKFMAGQWVLKGASCATPRGHSRATYRNFFYPRQRWQFTGLRLAQDR